MTDSLQAMAANIVEDGKVDAREAAMLRETIYADGVIDKDEATVLFQINDAVSGNDNDPAWGKLFVKAITDYVLADDTSPGVVDEDEAAFLIERIQGDGKVDDIELQLLVNITAKATSCTDTFNAFVLDSVKAAVLDDGIVDDDEVAMIRTVIYGTGGGGGEGVDRAEADMLFAINDAVTGKENTSGWQDLFVEALTAHVLEDDESPGAVDADEASYLIDQIQGDGQVDAAELALLINVTDKATSCTDEFNAFVLGSLEAAVLADGVIDDDEITQIKTVIYGSGGGAGEGVDRAEADFLFRLNDAVTGNNNTAAWQTLFVEAISKHVLEDDESPGAIDNDEATWLLAKIDGDGQIDDTEKALLANIKANATSIDDTLQARLTALGISNVAP